jgi:hypothetical protein
MPPVYRIMVRCPVTRRMIDSGIRTSGREAASSALFQESIVSCPYCRQLHSLENNSCLDVDRSTSTKGLWRPNR